MKMLKLHTILKIEKETARAVAVAPKSLTEDDKKTVDFLFWTTGTTIKGDLFWLPKSQITIDGGNVIAVTSWIEAQNFKFYDTPLFLERDFQKAQKIKMGE